jgi:hypothetical protein
MSVFDDSNMCSLHILSTRIAAYRKGLDGSVCGKITRPREQILFCHDSKVCTLDRLATSLVVSRVEDKEGWIESFIHEFLSAHIEATSRIAHRRRQSRLKLRDFVNKINRIHAPINDANSSA